MLPVVRILAGTVCGYSRRVRLALTGKAELRLDEASAEATLTPLLPSPGHIISRAPQPRLRAYKGIQRSFEDLSGQRPTSIALGVSLLVPQ